MKAFQLAALLLASTLFGATAQANLITNGSFEDNDVNNGAWAWFTSDNVNGWEGDNIEIWDSYGGVEAAHGEQHAELNAHPGDDTTFSIYQTFATEIGKMYEVSFFYRARANDSEAFNLSVGSLFDLIDDQVTGQWSHYTGSFLAEATSTTLMFTTTGTGTVGNFLDGVEVASVAEPGSLVLLALGLLGLVQVRRKS